MGTGKVTVAGIQFAGIPEQKQDNLETAIRLIRAAAGLGAQVVMSPEVVLTGFVGGAAERNMAESIPGPTTRVLGDLARTLDLYILFGLSELREGELHNSMAVIGRTGELVGIMRKVHINKYETPGGWRNGSEFPVWQFETSSGSFCAGIMICYDREVPESARLLMLKGADVIFNPLACRCPTDDIHRCLLRTRAFENEVYILMVNHAAPRQNGHSMVFDNDGTILKELGEEEGILLHTFDFDRLNAARANGIYAKHHRRPELYGLLCDSEGQVHPENANLPPDAE
jgi:predicted amidohydrolase